MSDSVRYSWRLRVAEALALAVLVLMLPVLPALVAMLARDTASLVNYGLTLRRSVRMLSAMARTRVIPRSLKRRWQEASSARIEGTCTHCGNCCVQRSCVFLSFDAAGQSACVIHGSALWRLTSCGRYPIDGADIAVYACPSYRIAIPITPIPAPTN